jgi:hypothetical protein
MAGHDRGVVADLFCDEAQANVFKGLAEHGVTVQIV